MEFKTGNGWRCCYDPETGLFGGKKIDELDGPKFTEADLQVPAPAALDPME